ncbi:hypothetical protein FF38_06108 [Lucilia cuprina]|uniref:Uncharacterized protein n=1 Tax=Lucilia cuprina TaxID=7375 RepID=A0A0L0CCQ2_LUCCU|nr:hypothetical protein FF38_06108 [Lucilia cuprina]
MQPSAQAGGKRKGGRLRGDTSDVTGDEASSFLPEGSSVPSCTDSEFELSDAGGKRRKPGYPRLKSDVASDKAEVVPDSFVSAEDAPKERCYRKKKGKSKEMAKVVRKVDCSVGALKAITDELTDILLSSRVDSTVTRGVLRQSSRYENERLKGRLESAVPGDGHAVFVAPKPVGAKAPIAASETIFKPNLKVKQTLNEK